MNRCALLNDAIATAWRIFFAVMMVSILCVAPAAAIPPFCLQFDGTNYVDLGSSPSLYLNNEVTLEAWIWAPPIPDNAMWPILGCQYDANSTGVAISLDGRLSPDGSPAVRRHINFQLGTGVFHPSNSNYCVPENQWVHIAATRRALEDARIYYNGVLQPSSSAAWDSPLAITTGWSIGRRTNVPIYYQGKIDEVRVWSRALTQDEVRDVMCRQLSGTEFGLAGYWRLNEGLGTTTADATGHGNTGTLTNGPVWWGSDLFATVQPDAQIKNCYETAYSGVNTYNDLPTKTQTVAPGIAAVYDVLIINKRVVPDRFMIVGIPLDNGWTAKYTNESAGGTNITTQVTTVGWKSDLVGSGDSLRLRIEVEPDITVGPGMMKDVVLNALSTSDGAKHDAVKTTTTAGDVMSSAKASVYTLDSDFDLGSSLGLEHQTTHNQLQLQTSITAPPVIWVPNNNQGTVSKLDTVTGREIARYRTSPFTTSQPSRTTVDAMGNCWVANRQIGTVVKIGLRENGEWNDLNANGVCDTSRDADGDGLISDSEMPAWGADECVIYEIVVIPGYEGTFTPGTYLGPYANDYWNPGPRGIAADCDNNVWIGTFYTHKYYKVDANTGIITSVLSTGEHTAYGAVVDRNGTLWSSGYDTNHLLRLDTRTGTTSIVDVGHLAYGLGLDWTSHLFVSGYTSGYISRFNAATSGKDWTKTIGSCKGMAVSSDGNVWTGNFAAYTVTRYTNDGTWVADIPVGMYPTGMAIDAAGKIWVTGEVDERVMRIDPATNTVDLTVRIPGTTHYSYSDMTGAISMNVTSKVGTWTVIHDSGAANTQWGIVGWNATTPMGTSISVQVRSSSNCRAWSQWTYVVNGQPFVGVPQGRFLQVRVMLRKAFGPTSPVLSDLAIIPMANLGTIAAAKTATATDTVFLKGIDVGGMFDGFFYVENELRNMGMRVDRVGHGLQPGQAADVYGVVKTNINDERYIEASAVIADGTGNVDALGVTNKTLGGADWLDPVTHILGQKGVTGGLGLNNIGLLVTAWGKVTQIDTAIPATWFKISDGSGVDVKCLVPSGVVVNPSWGFVTVMGISSCERVDAEVRRLLRVRTQGDIRSY